MSNDEQTPDPKRRKAGDDPKPRVRWRSRRERSREDTFAAWAGDFSELENEAMQQKPKRLNKVMESVLAKLEEDDMRVLREIVDQWEQLVGAEVAAASAPQRIERQTLYVEVTKATWRYRLNLQKRELSRKIHHFTDGEVTDIRLVTGGRSATR